MLLKLLSFAARKAGQTVMSCIGCGVSRLSAPRWRPSGLRCGRAMWEYGCWISAHTITICQENDSQSVKNLLRLFPGSGAGVVGKWEVAGWAVCFQVNIADGICRWCSHLNGDVLSSHPSLFVYTVVGSDLFTGCRVVSARDNCLGDKELDDYASKLCGQTIHQQEHVCLLCWNLHYYLGQTYSSDYGL